MKKVFPFEAYAQYLSAFSGHSVEYKGILYSTVEHAYHCQRYSDQKILDEIKSARSAYKAWEISQKYKSQQFPDFDDKKVAVMEDICRTKLEQHDDIKRALVESGEDPIVKDYPDAFWGIGPDGIGRNEMGKIWTKLRSELN